MKNEPTVRRQGKFLDAGLRGYVAGIGENRATRWAQALTRRDRETYLREMAPVVAEIQSRMAACNRLNKKEARNVPES